MASCIAGWLAQSGIARKEEGGKLAAQHSRQAGWALSRPSPCPPAASANLRALLALFRHSTHQQARNSSVLGCRAQQGRCGTQLWCCRQTVPCFNELQMC